MIVAQNELKYVADTRTDLDPQLPLVPCLPGECGRSFAQLRDRRMTGASLAFETRRPG